MFDIRPQGRSELAVHKLQHRQSYMAKAPYQQHKSKRKALSDAALKFSPVTWLGPAIIKAHDRYEYKRDRKRTQEVCVEYQERRKSSMSTPRRSIADLEIYPAPVEWWPIGMKEQDEMEDPRKLPPVEEIH